MYHSRSFCVGNETAQVRILECFFFFFFLAVYVTEGFVHFLHTVAKSPFLLFQNKWTNIRRGEQSILNKYNKFG